MDKSDPDDDDTPVIVMPSGVSRFGFRERLLKESLHYKLKVWAGGFNERYF